MFFDLDITFCISECDNKNCFRHSSHIPINEPVSMSYLKGTTYCPNLYCSSKCYYTECSMHKDKANGDNIQFKELANTSDCEYILKLYSNSDNIIED